MAKFQDLRIGDQIMIGDARVTLVEKSGRLARLKIDAPLSIRVSVIEKPKPHETHHVARDR